MAENLPPRIGLGINLESRDGKLDKSPRIINGYVEEHQGQSLVYKRPALDLASSGFDAYGQGMAAIPIDPSDPTAATLLLAIANATIFTASPVYTTGLQVDVQEDHGISIRVMCTWRGYIYAGSGGGLYRCRPPDHKWELVATFGASLNSGGFVFNDVIYVQANGPLVYASSDGVTFSEIANQPSAGANLGIVNGTLVEYVNLAHGATYYHSADRGATAWSSGTITNGTGYSPTNNALTPHGATLLSINGSAGDVVLTTSDGATWTLATASPGWTDIISNSRGSGGEYDSYAIMGVTTATDIEFWRSADGATWVKMAEITRTTSSSYLNLVTQLGNRLYFMTSDLLGYFEVSSGLTVTDRGSITLPTTSQSSITSNAPASAVTVFFKGPTAAYTINLGTFTVTQVTDADYPANTVRGAPYLNGYFFVMEPDGTIWNSAEDDPTSWAATDFANAEFEPDGGVCLAKHGEYIVAIGTYTTEPFYFNSDNTTSPLSPVINGVILVGCCHENTVAQVEQSLVWVAQQKAQGTTFHKGRFVVVLQGLTYKRISTPDIERVLNADGFSEVYADILTSSGHTFYVLTLMDSGITLVYDFTSGIWGEWNKSVASASKAITSITQSSGTATVTTTYNHGLSDGDQVTISGADQSGYNLTVNVTVTSVTTFTYPVDSSTVSPATGTIVFASWNREPYDLTGSVYFNGFQLAQFRNSGFVNVLSDTSTDDNGAPIDFSIITKKQDGNTQARKFMPRIDVIGDTVSSTGLLRYTDDDFANWSTYRRIDMSGNRMGLNRLGQFIKRNLQFRHTLSAKVRLEALEPTITESE